MNYGKNMKNQQNKRRKVKNSDVDMNDNISIKVLK